MSKSVYLINFEESQSNMGQDLSNSLTALEVPNKLVPIKSFALDIGGSNKFNRLLFNAEELPTDNILFFLRKRHPEQNFFSALLTKFFIVNKIQHLNDLFAQHQKNVGKIAQGINLSSAGFRIPRTIICPTSAVLEMRQYVEHELMYPFVMKGNGSGGNAVWLVNEFDEIKTHLDKSNDRTKDVVVFQEYIEQSQEEYRVVFFGNQVVACVKRSSNEFYNNYAQGAQVEPYKLPDAERLLCAEIANTSGLDYVSVDYMKIDNDTMVFLEVQSGPSYKVSTFTNPKMTDEISALIKSKFLQT